MESFGSVRRNMAAKTTRWSVLRIALTLSVSLFASIDPTRAIAGNPLPTAITIAQVYPEISYPGQNYFIVFQVVADIGTPTGTVSIAGDLGAACGPVDLAEGWGGCALVSTDAGTESLTISYASDDAATFESSDIVLAHLVDARATTASLDAVMPETSVSGQPVDVFYSVYSLGALASGTVVASAATGESCSADLAAGQCTITFATAGARDIGVAYFGDIDHDASSSSALNHVVERAATSLAVDVFPTEPVAGESVMFTVTVSPTGFGAGVPSGTISIAGAETSCDAVLVAGVGMCSLTPTSAGQQIFALTYSGDDDFAPSEGEALELVGNPLVAINDTFATLEDTTLIVPPELGVLANDSGADGVTLTVTSAGALTAGGIGGDVMLYADGSLSYTPPADANGDAYFDYTVSDGVASLTATATITVGAVNDPPSFLLSENPAWPPSESGAKSAPGFASVLAFGPPDESGQHVRAWKIRKVVDPDGIVAAPSIALDGTLTYSLTGNNGSATLAVALQDDGGTDHGGIDVSTEQTFVISVGGGADLSISVDDGVSFVDSGSSLTYTIVARNAGPLDVSGARITDALPPGFSGASWTCEASDGASCSPSGNGDIDDVADIPAGSMLTYLLSATLTASSATPIANSATIAPPADVVDWSSENNTATDSDQIGIFGGGFDH